ncbi:hypothetical protein B0T14DRAFT_324834 [Immersiella caudata]|uniref:Uncharacterized protein n=1 Tax=Immersiella caudata TaxID=314043 RepID=A0AA39W4D5_9PEZI|nr:hypothetical protein B0T14DRAFT_324834 [Immersiella caudata]
MSAGPEDLMGLPVALPGVLLQGKAASCGELKLPPVCNAPPDCPVLLWICLRKPRQRCFPRSRSSSRRRSHAVLSLGTWSDENLPRSPSQSPTTEPPRRSLAPDEVLTYRTTALACLTETAWPPEEFSSPIKRRNCCGSTSPCFLTRSLQNLEEVSRFPGPHLLPSPKREQVLRPRCPRRVVKTLAVERRKSPPPVPYGPGSAVIAAAKAPI